MNIKTIYKLVFLIFYTWFPAGITAQSAPISIDGNFDDWNENLSHFTDSAEGNGIDLLEMQVTNDANFLYIHLITDTEFSLATDLIPQGLQLYIDTDNNAATGYPVQTGYGSELKIIFKDRQVFININGNYNTGFAAIKLRPAPTITSQEFEIAIGRDIVPDGMHPLFTSPTVKILFKDSLGGDRMPDAGNIYSYTFDETPVPPLIPTDLQKSAPDFIRVLAYNTLFDGLTDNARIPYFKKIIQLLKPDIIGFSECYNTSASEVKVLLDSWLPLRNSYGWFINKDASGDLITASRWQILNEWNDLYREYPVLINLPDYYQTDMVFTNAHLRCCNNNAQRQDQVDAYVAFMLDATKEGGDVNFPENTPFVYAGDLNLVGYAAQLNTLLTGNIQNTATYGEGAPYDWDVSNPSVASCRQSDVRMAYTWQDDATSYPPGRLDYMIYSDAVLHLEKSFCLNTETMSPERLQIYGLDAYDNANASDHFPVISDFSIPASSISVASKKIPGFTYSPNPVHKVLHLAFHHKAERKIRIFDTKGAIVYQSNSNRSHVAIALASWPAGVYTMHIQEVNTTPASFMFIKE